MSYYYIIAITMNSTEKKVWELLDAYSKGAISPEEKREFFTAISEDSSLLTRIAGNIPLEGYTTNYQLDTEAKQRILEAIFTAEKQVKPGGERSFSSPVVHRVHFLKTAWFRYAAAVLLLIGAAITWYELSKSSSTSSTDQPSPVASVGEDIKPGTNRAILTVGNKTIDLATNKTGIAVGNVITYNDGEKIADAGKLSLLTTPRGGQYQLTLSDGSKVWLNAASSIKFPSKFTGDKREVEVTGEVYMEIAKNVKRPFFVHTKKTMVQVLGTSFNINAYEDEEKESTTLVEGSIKVGRIPLEKGDREEGSVVLTPGQAAEITNNSQQTTYKAVDLNQTLAWKNGLFYFNGENLETIMKQLARCYDVDVIYEGAVPDKHFGGMISRNKNLNEVLSVLEVSGVHFKVDGKKVIVLGN